MKEIVIVLLFVGLDGISSLIHERSSNSATPVTLENLDASIQDLSECGPIKETPKIYGGKATLVGEMPWMVAIHYRSVPDDGRRPSTLCAGSLINRRYILTTASCVNNSNKIPETAILGEWNTETDPDCISNECADPVQKVKIHSHFQHPDYNRKSAENDIGLIYLDADVTYSEFIRPICLPPKNLPFPNVGESITVAGWGRTEEKKLSSILLKVELPITPNEDCGTKLKMQVKSNRFCAGGEEGKDACTGDSGSPAVGVYYDDKNIGRWYQHGIVSLGAGCGKAGYSAIYTKVAEYGHWIVETIKKNNAL